MTVSGFRGTIPDITQWIGYSGNMQMVVALKPSSGGTVKTMEGAVVLNKGMDETISVTLGETAYQKTMDLTIHDGTGCTGIVILRKAPTPMRAVNSPPSVRSLMFHCFINMLCPSKPSWLPVCRSIRRSQQASPA